MKTSAWIPYLSTFLPICAANLPAQRQNIAVGPKACTALGQSLAIENVTVNFVQVRIIFPSPNPKHHMTRKKTQERMSGIKVYGMKE